ncbi:MAG TPA: ABC transporter permease [Verrucomicrobiae bacterium]|nr:ABC transporter permease [Verrucomicrobiae bacterium]
MTSLPIVERELRVSARRHLTYWLRVAGAGGLLLVFGLMFTVGTFSRGSGMGIIIFSVLKWIAYIVAACMVFVASDVLSEEKREGTLGLLFLTDLKGYDVVLGKLFSMSLQSFYALLAGMPVLALPLIMGGVTGTEFWRTLLVIFNTMFFSLAVGLFVSSMSREVLKAMNMGGIINLVFLVGLPWGDWARVHWDVMKWKPVLSYASPGYLFAAVSSAPANFFWESLGLQHAIAWLFLIAACVIVPRAWQEGNNQKTGWWANFSTRWRFGGKRWRLAFRQKLMGRDPILWLALRDRWLPRFALAVTFVVMVLAVADVYKHWKDNQQLMYMTTYSFLLNLGVTLWLASQASRFYVDAVRSGAMELMLVTPLHPAHIVRSQWKALVRTFLLPVLLLFAFKIASDAESIMGFKKMMATMKAMPKSPAGFPGNYDWMIREIVQMAGNLINFGLWLTALAWFGMWMGVTTRKVSFAVVKAILLVCLVPWFLELFVMGWGAAMIFTMHLPMWVAAVPPIVVEMAKNIFFIVISRHQLNRRFRQMVVNRSSPQKIKLFAFPPPLPATTRPLVS